MTVTVQKHPVYLGAGLARPGWRIYDDDTMVGYAFSEEEAAQWVTNLQEQKEHRDGA